MKGAISLSILSFLFFGCADFPSIPPSPASTGVSPKVIDLAFDADFNGTSSEWQLLNQNEKSQFNFEIGKYQNVDSVIFKASLRSERQNVRCVVDVYNLTDNTSLAGSTLFSRIRYQLHSVRSRDIKYEFPNKPVLLGVRVRSEGSGNHVEARHFSLLVYYH